LLRPAFLYPAVSISINKDVKKKSTNIALSLSVKQDPKYDLFEGIAFVVAILRTNSNCTERKTLNARNWS
jgi:hypothetical protein